MGYDNLCTKQTLNTHTHCNHIHSRACRVSNNTKVSKPLLKMMAPSFSLPPNTTLNKQTRSKLTYNPWSFFNSRVLMPLSTLRARLVQVLFDYAIQQWNNSQMSCYNGDETRFQSWKGGLQATVNLFKVNEFCWSWVYWTNEARPRVESNK